MNILNKKTPFVCVCVCVCGYALRTNKPKACHTKQKAYTFFRLVQNSYLTATSSFNEINTCFIYFNMKSHIV